MFLIRDVSADLWGPFVALKTPHPSLEKETYFNNVHKVRDRKMEKEKCHFLRSPSDVAMDTYYFFLNLCLRLSSNINRKLNIIFHFLCTANP
jgi:hypothetical protein